jgi:hypothetical protein
VTILEFRVPPKPPQFTVEEWEIRLVFDFLTFLSEHGVDLEIEEAIYYTQAILRGQDVIDIV